MTRDTNRAEDLASETFVRAWFRQTANRVITLAIVIAFGTLVIGGAALTGAMFILAR